MLPTPFLKCHREAKTSIDGGFETFLGASLQNLHILTLCFLSTGAYGVCVRKNLNK